MADCVAASEMQRGQLDNNALNTERQALVDEVQRLEQALLNARTRLNVLTPIGKLSTELLAEVFHWCTFMREKPRYNRLPNPLWWVKVTMVCRYWRDVAINAPQLWTTIDAGWSHNGASICIERSKDMLIDVVANESTLRATDLAKGALIMQQAHRIRTLELEVRRSEMQEIFQSLWPEPIVFPRLRRLLLKSPSGVYGGRDGKLSNLNIRSDSIQELCLGGIDKFSWAIVSQYASLRLLETSSIATSLTEILGVLGSLPHLITLGLHGLRDTSKENSEHSHGILPIVKLPSLQDLSLDGQGSLCINVLTHLCFPKQVRLALYISSATVDELPKLQDLLQQRAARVDTTVDPSSLPITLQIKQGASRRYLTIGSWPTLEDTRSIELRTRAQLRLCIPPTGHGGLLGTVAFSHTRHLLLSCRGWAVPLEALCRALELCKNVERVQLAYWPIAQMVRLLGPQKTGTEQDSTTNLDNFLFPKLQELVLLNVSFVFHAPNEPSGVVYSTGSFRGVLRSRKSAGLPPVVTVLRRCMGVSPQSVELFNRDGLVAELIQTEAERNGEISGFESSGSD